MSTTECSSIELIKNLSLILLLVPLYALASIPTTIEYEAPPRSKSLEEMVGELRSTSSEPESLHELATRIAGEYDVPTSTLFNLVYYESRWKSDAVGDGGCSYGLVQINTCVWDITPEQAKNPEYALRFAADKIKNGDEYIFSVCNCYAIVQTNYPGRLPRMKDIVPNTPIPMKGVVAIFDYNGVKHIGLVTEVHNDGALTLFEGNKSKCIVGFRIVELSDPHLVGFWSAG